MTRLDQADHARGARVEIAIRAAQQGDMATAAGILAGMSREERDVFGPLVAAAAAAGRGEPPARGEDDSFGSALLDRLDRAACRGDPGFPRKSGGQRMLIRCSGPLVEGVCPSAALRRVNGLALGRGPGRGRVLSESSDAQGGPAWPALLRPRERVGWEFRDHNTLRRPFEVPRPVWSTDEETLRRRPGVFESWLAGHRYTRWLAVGYGSVAGWLWPVVVRRVFGGPAPEVIDDDTGYTRQEDRAKAAFSHRMALALPVSGGMFVAALVWGVSALFYGEPLGDGAALLITSMGVGVASGGAWIGAVAMHRRSVRRFWVRSRAGHLERLHGWLEANRQHDQAEAKRVEGMSDWVSARAAPGYRRVDVVGGNVYGWEALLTVTGSSMLAERRPVTVLDLTGEIAAGELVKGAADAGWDVGLHLLPTEIAHVDLLAGLDVGQVVNLFVEARYGGDGQPTLVERGLDEWVLRQVCEQLAEGGLSMGRIAAGLRVVMRQPGAGDVLAAEERKALTQQLFADEYRSKVMDNLVRLEALASPFAAMGSLGRGTEPVDLHVVAMSSQWSSGPEDFLSNLLVGWAARRVDEAPDEVGTLVIAGADELAVRHLERLSKRCDRRGVRLVTIFQHYGAVADAVVGDGPVAFMRLGSHPEAVRAADFIGREYHFVVSTLTRTLGGQDTHSIADSTSETEGTGGSSTTGQTGRGERRWPWGPWRARHWNSADTTAWNRSRTWGRTITEARTSSWSDASSSQRSKDYLVEPEAIQALPDYALLLVERSADGTRLPPRTVEINPEIAAMPGAPHEPDSEQPEPRQEQLPTAQVPALAVEPDLTQIEPSSVNGVADQAQPAKLYVARSAKNGLRRRISRNRT